MDSWKQLISSQRIVVKVGSSTLSYPNGRLNYQKVVKLVETIAEIQKTGKRIILVSSGAIAVGSGRLGVSSQPPDISDKQTLAAVGQAELIRIYRRFFEAKGQQVGQVLLTKDVVINPERRMNAHNTLNELISMNIIPIINENDTVATDEIEFGDNDTLSAYVACLANTDLLILLSDIDGLYTADPGLNPGAQLISEVCEITDKLENYASGAGSGLGTGGMVTKISAARICQEAGIKVVIANGSKPEIIWSILSGKESGTLFTWKDNNNIYQKNH